jgi:hypothetical protein
VNRTDLWDEPFLRPLFIFRRSRVSPNDGRLGYPHAQFVVHLTLRLMVVSLPYLAAAHRGQQSPQQAFEGPNTLCKKQRAASATLLPEHHADGS